MSSLRMSQVPGLRGLRGLGDEVAMPGCESELTALQAAQAAFNAARRVRSPQQVQLQAALAPANDAYRACQSRRGAPAGMTPEEAIRQVNQESREREAAALAQREAANARRIEYDRELAERAQREAAEPHAPAFRRETPAEIEARWAKLPDAPRSTSGAHLEVDRANDSAASLFSSAPAAAQEIDQSTTNLSFAAMPGRQGRVSPLSVSWGMPLQIQPIQSRTTFSRGITPMGVGLAAAGLLFGGAVLYMIFSGED
jgi:hypothetical protein